MNRMITKQILTFTQSSGSCLCFFTQLFPIFLNLSKMPIVTACIGSRGASQLSLFSFYTTSYIFTEGSTLFCQTTMKAGDKKQQNHQISKTKDVLDFPREG